MQVCKQGKDLLILLTSMTDSQLAYAIVTTYSEDVNSGEVEVTVDDANQQIEIVGSADDI